MVKEVETVSFRVIQNDEDVFYVIKANDMYLASSRRLNSDRAEVTFTTEFKDARQFDENFGEYIEEIMNYLKEKNLDGSICKVKEHSKKTREIIKMQ